MGQKLWIQEVEKRKKAVDGGIYSVCTLTQSVWQALEFLSYQDYIKSRVACFSKAHIIVPVTCEEQTLKINYNDFKVRI